MKKHLLKIWPRHFQAIVAGEMPCQIRLNDRDFSPGDLLILEEFEPDTERRPNPTGSYTGATHRVLVNRVFADVPGLVKGYVLLTTRPYVER